jgi:hypothetical protein
MKFNFTLPEEFVTTLELIDENIDCKEFTELLEQLEQLIIEKESNADNEKFILSYKQISSLFTVACAGTLIMKPYHDMMRKKRKKK